MSPLDPRLSAGVRALVRVLPAFGLRVVDSLTVPATPSGSVARFPGAVRLELALDGPGRRRSRSASGVRVEVEGDSFRYGALGGSLPLSRSAVAALARAESELAPGGEAPSAASNDLVRRARDALAAGPYADLLTSEDSRVLDRLRRDLPEPSSVSVVLAATGVFEDDRAVVEVGARVLLDLASGAPIEWVVRRLERATP